MSTQVMQQAIDALLLSQAYIGPDSAIVPGWGEQLDMNDAAIDSLRAAIAQSVQPAAQVGFTQIGVFTSQVQRHRCIWWDSGTQPEGTPIYIAAIAQPVQPAALTTEQMQDWLRAKGYLHPARARSAKPADEGRA